MSKDVFPVLNGSVVARTFWNLNNTCPRVYTTQWQFSFYLLRHWAESKGSHNGNTSNPITVDSACFREALCFFFGPSIWPTRLCSINMIPCFTSLSNGSHKLTKRSVLCFLAQTIWHFAQTVHYDSPTKHLWTLVVEQNRTEQIGVHLFPILAIRHSKSWCHILGVFMLIYA